MIFPRQILYGAELIKSYFSIPFTNLSKINNKFHKCFKLKKDKKIIFTSKGRTALYLILKYLKIYKKKNEVIMSPFTIFDLVNIVISSGCKPIFVDHNKDSFEMDCNKIIRIIKKNKKISSIIITHYCFNSENIFKLRSICRKYNIKIIQDCAIAASSKYKNKSITNLSEYSFLSFNLFKFVPALTGGAIITSDNNLCNYANIEQNSFKTFNLSELFTLEFKSILIKILTNKIIFSMITFHIFKFGEINNIKWIIKFTKNDPNPYLRKKLDNFEKHKINKFQIHHIKKRFIDIEKYRKVRANNFATLYRSIKSNNVKLIAPSKSTDHSFINFPILVDDKKKFRDFLFKNNFDSSKYFYRNCNNLNIFKKYKSNCKNLDKFEKQLIFLPIHHEITKLHINKLAKLINRY